MTQDMLESRNAALIVQFAPIRLSSDEFAGPTDPQTCRVQNNQFVHYWRSDEPLLYCSIREGFTKQWGSFAGELSKHYDAVAALQVDYQQTMVLPTMEFRASAANVAAAAAAGSILSIRRSIPPLGTLRATLEPIGTSHVRVSLSVLGHPGTPLLNELLQWVDAANALMQQTLAGFFGRRQNTPHQRTREVPLE